MICSLILFHDGFTDISFIMMGYIYVIILLSMMGDGFEHRAAGFLLKKELTYFSKVCNVSS